MIFKYNKIKTIILLKNTCYFILLNSPEIFNICSYIFYKINDVIITYLTADLENFILKKKSRLYLILKAVVLFILKKTY